MAITYIAKPVHTQTERQNLFFATVTQKQNLIVVAAVNDWFPMSQTWICQYDSYHRPAAVRGIPAVPCTAAAEGNPAAAVDPADTPLAADRTVRFLQEEEQAIHEASAKLPAKYNEPCDCRNSS